MAQVHPSPEVPSAVNQVYSTLDRQTATQLFKLMDKYRPETKQAKKERLWEHASARAEDKEDTPTKRLVLLTRNYSR
jgi:large subunit ribosomal protein L7Ae